MERAKEQLVTCRACGVSRPNVLSTEEIIELAKSVVQGKPTKSCPIEFSYVDAARVMAEYIVGTNHELKATDTNG